MAEATEKTEKGPKFHALDSVQIEGLEPGLLKTGKKYTVTGKTANFLIEKGSAKSIKLVKKFDKEEYNEKAAPKS